MLKSLLIVVAGISATLVSLPAGAIAPGVAQIGSCGRFTANKYRVQGNQLVVKIDRQTPRGYFLRWSVTPYRASGTCFVDNNARTTQWQVLRGPRPEAVTIGPNEKVFTNLPGYGDVVVNRGQSAMGERQYFLVRPFNTGKNLRWYARCGKNSDQVYDASGKYVGYDSGMTVMFSYVCEVSPLRPKPPVVPQPR